MVLDTIECAQITRSPNSSIIGFKEFNVVGRMNSPRCNFSAIHKPAVKCTETNCRYTKDKEPCTSEFCHNQEFIYIAGGQKVEEEKKECSFSFNVYLNFLLINKK